MAEGIQVTDTYLCKFIEAVILKLETVYESRIETWILFEHFVKLVFITTKDNGKILLLSIGKLRQ